jgi:ribose-phosphate pyrophosphokinase
MKIFALGATGDFGRRVADALGHHLSSLEERDFEDGEHKSRPLETVRDEDVYVVHSLYGDGHQSPNDKFCRLLFFLATVKENGARRVTAVIPYLAYARKDRQTKARDPVTSRYVAQLLEAAGADLVMGMEVHNPVAFQNAFRCQTVHLDGRRLLAAEVQRIIGDGALAIVSPDPGGVKRAQLFREFLEMRLGRPVAAAFAEKRRSAGQVSGHLLVGDVEGTTVFIIDDLISTGNTMIRAARACLDHGASQVFALATHGLFVGNAAQALNDPVLAATIVTDTVPSFRVDTAALGKRLKVVSAAPLFAEAIKRLSSGGSINDLLETVS